jgi:hypothetical protein
VADHSSSGRIGVSIAFQARTDDLALSTPDGRHCYANPGVRSHQVDNQAVRLAESGMTHRRLRRVVNSTERTNVTLRMAAPFPRGRRPVIPVPIGPAPATLTEVRESLLVNFVHFHPVGHAIEGLHYAHGYHRANPDYVGASWNG